jgi:hypothetical protein
MPALFCYVVVAVCDVDAAEAAPGFASPDNSNLLVADLEAFSARLLKSVDPLVGLEHLGLRVEKRYGYLPSRGAEQRHYDQRQE